MNKLLFTFLTAFFLLFAQSVNAVHIRPDSITSYLSRTEFSIDDFSAMHDIVTHPKYSDKKKSKLLNKFASNKDTDVSSLNVNISAWIKIYGIKEMEKAIKTNFTGYPKKYVTYIVEKNKREHILSEDQLKVIEVLNFFYTPSFKEVKEDVVEFNRLMNGTSLSIEPGQLTFLKSFDWKDEVDLDASIKVMAEQLQAFTRMDELIEYMESNEVEFGLLYEDPFFVTVEERSIDFKSSVGYMFYQRLLRLYSPYINDKWRESVFNPGKQLNRFSEIDALKFQQILEDDDLRSSVIGLMVLCKWHQYEQEKLKNSEAAKEYRTVFGRGFDFWDVLETFEEEITEITDFSFKGNAKTDGSHLDYLFALVHNRISMTPRLGLQLDRINDFDVNTFELSDAERTIINGISTKGFDHAGIDLLKNDEVRKKLRGRIHFRFALFIKMVQVSVSNPEHFVIDESTKWYGLDEPYLKNTTDSSIVSMYEKHRSAIADTLQKYRAAGKSYLVQFNGKRMFVRPEVNYGATIAIVGAISDYTRSAGRGNTYVFKMYFPESEFPEKEWPVAVVQTEPKIAYPVPPPPRPRVKSDRPVKAEIIDFPDKEAEFPGGSAAMQKYISENVKFPEEALKSKTYGKVYLSFVVEADGSISRVKVVKGVSKELDGEAKRLVQSMPKWVPGEANGKKAATRCMLPIIFTP